jgi:hypothetical protein
VIEHYLVGSILTFLIFPYPTKERTMSTDLPEMDRGALELMAQLVERNADSLNHTTNTIIDNLTEDNANLKAELHAVRWKIQNLLKGQYMPTPNAIMDALYPGKYLIDKFKDMEFSQEDNV